MKKLAIMLLLCSLSAVAQNGRWDLQGTTTQAQGGNLLPVYAIPGASVSFLACSSNVPSSCTSAAVTYTGAGTACPSTTPVNPQGSLACTSKSDTAGNFGAWFASGTYAYSLTASGKRYGPFLFSVGAGSASGTVSTFSAGTLPPLFTTAVANPNTTPSLSFTASTAAQNSILAGPSSGGTGAYSFRALAVADVPTLNQNTTGTAGGLSGSPAILVSNLTDSALTPGQCAQASTGGLLVSVACGGSVVNFGAGNLSPIFTTTVTSSTTNPFLAFTLTNAAQNSVLAGPATGGAGTPSYQTAPTISAANMTNFPAMNLSGGVLGSVPYQSAVDTTALLAPPTVGKYILVEYAVGSSVAPTWENSTGTNWSLGVNSIAGNFAQTIAPGASAQTGTGATAVCATSHICDSFSGVVTLTTGTGSLSAGTIATVTSASPRTNLPNCLVSIDGNAAFVGIGNSTTVSILTITTAVALSASTAYNLHYICGGV